MDEGEWLSYRNQPATPKEILNIYSMDITEEKRRKYFALMNTILREDARTQLEGGRDVRELAEDVVEKAEDRLNKWHSSDRSLDTVLADVVVKSGMVIDWGTMAVGKMGWGWEYKVENGEVVRKRQGGDLFKATDIKTLHCWRDKDRSNKTAGITDSGIMPPMSDGYIEELTENAPSWKPGNSQAELQAELNNDPVLRAAWDRLWSGNWDEKAKRRLQSMVWFWETPYKDKLSGRKIKVPFFFPPEIDSMNFLDAVTDEEGGLRHSYENIDVQGNIPQESEGGPTIWKKLQSGTKLSEIDWTKMNDQAFFRWMVTIQQQVRWAQLLIDPQSTEGYWGNFRLSGNLKELHKRVALGNRDEKESVQVMNLALTPQTVVLKLADEYSVFGLKGKDSNTVGDWSTALQFWATEMSGLPKKVGDVDNYNDSMTKMLDFYTEIIARAGVVRGEVVSKEVTQRATRMRDTLAGHGIKARYEGPWALFKDKSGMV
jgi:hypothetical protein